MKFKPLLIAAAGLLALSAQATTVTQWDFNGATLAALAVPSTTLTSANASLVGGVSGTVASGSGSTDTATTNNSLNTSTYAAQGAGDLTRGVRFDMSTVGFENLVFSFDQRNSATAAVNTALLYTLDSIAATPVWLQATVFTMPSASSGSFLKGISFDFSSVAGVSNNANFAVELLATFASSTSSYAPTVSTSTYGAGGTIRYDMVTLSGTAISPVPEPETLSLLLAGLGCVGMVVRRRAA